MAVQARRTDVTAFDEWLGRQPAVTRADCSGSEDGPCISRLRKFSWAKTRARTPAGGDFRALRIKLFFCAQFLSSFNFSSLRGPPLAGD